jgi:hypothetical protein
MEFELMTPVSEETKIFLTLGHAVTVSTVTFRHEDSAKKLSTIGTTKIFPSQ